MPTKPTIWTPGYDSEHPLYLPDMNIWPAWEGENAVVNDLVSNFDLAPDSSAVWSAGPPITLDMRGVNWWGNSSNTLEPAGDWMLGLRFKLNSPRSSYYYGLFSEWGYYGENPDLYGRAVEVEYGGNPGTSYVTCYLGDGSAYYAGAFWRGTLDPDAWHNAVVFHYSDTSTTKVYVDGTAYPSGDAVGTTIDWTQVYGTVYLGFSDFDSVGVDGWMDTCYHWPALISPTTLFDASTGLEADWYGLIRQASSYNLPAMQNSYRRRRTQ